MRNILIVDDDLAQAKLFGKFVSQMDYNVIYVDGGQDAIDFLLGRKMVSGISSNEVDVMLLDISMPEVDGLEVLRQVAKKNNSLQIIVLSSDAEINMAVSAMSLGAVDYIVKSGKDVFTRISTSVSNAIATRNLKNQISFSERSDSAQVSFSDLVGSSDPFLKAINIAKKINNSTVSVLIEGQIGTGKEFLAKAIHGSSLKAEMPFISVDCSKLRHENIDDILFGYKTTLSSGKEDKGLGKIRKAHNGTLLLNNIDALPIDTQNKLLHFIQEGEIFPRGGKVVSGINVRIISTTTNNLRLLSQRGRFKEDLYYCLSIFVIYLPTLHERGPEDIKALAGNFSYNFNINENKKIKGISDEAYDLLGRYGWEGNIRQLRNYVFRAVILCDDKYIETKHFPGIVESENGKLNNQSNYGFGSNFINYDGKFVDLFDFDGKCKTWAQIGQEIVRQLFDAYDGNLSEISKNLKISRSTIYRKLNITKE